ncbi:MAG TPA: hypothetical protein VMT50_00705 [Steroidobacteraceae bacterium]|nr:hypothetical protein [Steroidobacteraceae bacterium]
MNTLGFIVLATAASGLLSALAAGFFMLLGDHWRAIAQPHLVSFATGTLLAAAFMSDTRLGIVTAIAIGSHEVPQGSGDLAIPCTGASRAGGRCCSTC